MAISITCFVSLGNANIISYAILVFPICKTRLDHIFCAFRKIIEVFSIAIWINKRHRYAAPILFPRSRKTSFFLWMKGKVFFKLCAAIIRIFITVEITRYMTPSLHSIQYVIVMSDPFKIISPAISPVKIYVVHFFISIWVIDKCTRNKYMNAYSFAGAML